MSGNVNQNVLSDTDREQLAKLGLYVDSNGLVTESNNLATLDDKNQIEPIAKSNVVSKDYSFSMGEVVSGEIQGVVIKPEAIVRGKNHFTLYEEDYSLLKLAKQIVSLYSKNGVAIFIPEYINNIVPMGNFDINKIKEYLNEGIK